MLFIYQSVPVQYGRRYFLPIYRSVCRGTFDTDRKRTAKCSFAFRHDKNKTYNSYGADMLRATPISLLANVAELARNAFLRDGGIAQRQ